MVCISIVVGSSESPARETIEKTYSFGYLCRLYKELEGSDFDPKSYAEEKNLNLEAYRRQGEKTMAWAVYGQISYMKKLIKQENVINNLPRDSQAKQRKEFEEQNGAGMIRIE